MWNYFNPVAIHGGRGQFEQIQRLVGRRRVFVAAFPESVEQGWLARLESQLGSRLVGAATDLGPLPSRRALKPAYERFWTQHADTEVILALGGGSVMDAAKVLMVRTLDRSFDQLMQVITSGRRDLVAGSVPLICIPTTAGTGSEVTPWATVWDPQADPPVKHSLHLSVTWPEAAVLDPELTVGLPPAQTLHTGLDALSHSFEAIWNRNRNPVSTSHAIGAARGILDTLPRVLEQPRSLALRERMAAASTQAGLAFSNTQTALAHSLSYDLTMQQGTPHGIACSFSLPRIMAMVAGMEPDIDRALQAVFDAPVAAGAERLERFLQSLGVATDPADHGIPPGDWERRVAEACAGQRGRNFVGAAAGLEPEPGKPDPATRCELGAGVA